jgi:small redox-active disulfide protein 2
MTIKILGSGCPNCQKLEANTKEAIKELNLDAKIKKVTDITEIMNYGIMSTPALVADEKVLSYGRIPDVAEIKAMLANQKITKSASNNSTSKTGGCSCEGKC